MRRLVSSLLLAAISFTLIPLTLLASDGEANLPACCRKAGKHKCAMSDEQPAGESLAAVSQCPLFPRTAGVPASGVTAVTVPEHVQFALLEASPNGLEQAEAQYRISFSRSRQKRGPPR